MLTNRFRSHDSLRWSMRAALLMMLCAFSAQAGTIDDANFSDNVFVSDSTRLGNNPASADGQVNGITSMHWAPDGANRLYVTVKGRADANAHVQIIRDGVLQSVSFYTFNSGIETNNECGLMSLVFHPDYASGTKQIYCFVTVSNTEQQVVRFTETIDVNGNYVATGAPQTIISGIPTAGQNHNGGGLAIAPDQNGNGRFLYWAAGNSGNGVNRGERLDNTNLGCKVGRANLDGSVPTDGLNASGYIWAYGYRNPYTMTVQPSTGKLWINVVGDSYEQIFVSAPGSWAGDNDFENFANPNDATLRAKQINPLIKYRTGGTDTRTLAAANSAARSGTTVTYTTTSRHGFQKGEKITVSGVSAAGLNGTFYVLSAVTDTTFTATVSGTDASGNGGGAVTQNYGNCITGGVFNDKTIWPTEYRNNFFFGDYGSGRIVRAQLNADNSVKQVDSFLTGGGRITDVTFGPDGHMYYAQIDAGTIRKVAYNALTISTASPLAVTTVGAAYNQTLAVSGGTAPYTWSLLSGTLPAGLSLSSAGAISGTPTTSFTSNFRVRATDSASRIGEKDFTIVVNATPSISTSSLPGGNVGIAYSQTLNGSGGTAPIVWSISAGTLPAGLTLNASSGLISGTPTTAATSTFTVMRKDALNVSATRQLSIAITSGNSAPQITSTATTNGNIGVAYTYDVNASGNPTPAYSLTVSPAGMTINSGSGIINWTPATSGAFNVTAKAANGTAPDATQSFTINVTDFGLEARAPASANLGLNTAALPATLSATGIFSNTPNMTAAAALVPYGVNSPLWSDAAEKRRWIAVPNDGAPYSASETIAFAPTGEWTFPAGTVLIKHFELNTDERNPAIKKRLETRLLFVSAGSVFGATYKWRADGLDADLLPDFVDENITITSPTGATRTQSWHYPSRNECLQCHTPNSGGVLGVKTRQQNGSYNYPSGVSDNQLRTWNHIGMFSTALNEAAIPSYSKLAPLNDNAASLEHRVRSYLDSNCSQCHRPAGAPTLFDARFDTPLSSQNIINGPVNNPLGISGARIVVPQDTARSMMYHRTNTLDATIKMPPLARNVIDAQSISVLGQWINNLPSGSGIFGTYYDNMDFTGASVTRIDPEINFNWGTGSPIAGIAADTFSVRWTGRVQAQFTESYTFYTRTDDGVRLWANGQLLVDKWINQSSTEWSGTINLSAGQQVEIIMEIFENGGDASAQLSWSSASTPKGLIPQNVIFAAAPPSAPSNLIAVGASSSRIDLSWTDTPTTESGFEIERSSDGTTWSALASAATNATSYSDNGLSAATTWQYRVRAVNFAGKSAFAGPAIGTTMSSPPIPSAPTNLIAVAAFDTRIDLTWSDTSIDETGFEIERSPDAVTWSALATVPANTATYANTGLSASTTRHYRVRAVNGNGSSAYAGPASATTLALPPVAVKINFQLAGAPIPSGYMADTGAVFGDRGNGFSYGWNANNSTTARDRNSPTSPDQRYDTLEHLQKPENPSAVWEIALPNNTYSVRVVSGDPSNIDSVYKTNVEGVLTISATPTSTQRWFEGTKSVTVADGRLTITNAAGSANNKICFVDITGQAAAPREFAEALADEFIFNPSEASSMTIGMNARKKQQKSGLKIKLSGIPGDTILKDQEVGVDVGGAVMNFKLNAKGKASTAEGRCTVKLKRKTEEARITIKMLGSWAQAWEDAGVVQAIKSEKELPFSLCFAGHCYGGVRKVKFNGKSGKAEK